MRYTLLFLFVFFSGALLADNVTAEQARALAIDFFKTSIQTRSTVSPQLQMVWDGEDVNTRNAGTFPAFYVFNSTDRKGFVVIAGDDAVMPVLGYSSTDSFVVDGMPTNLKSWMNGLREQINEARMSGLVASDAVAKAWTSLSKTAAGTVVKEYETANWNQLDPYNTLCPEIRGSRTVTGCVATAISILMRYHQWPDAGVGILPAYNYEAESSGTRMTIPERSLGNTYDWNMMPLQYDRNSSETAKNEVATLMYDCGVMAQARFNTASAGGTGAATLTAVQGLAKYMKYNKGMLYLFREWYSDAEWIQMLKDELETVGPVLYGGMTLKDEGHQFILGGYTTDDYFKVNWGWGGASNGFFLLSALDPDAQGAGGASGGGFTQGQDAVLGLTKEDTNSDYQSLLGMFASGSYVGLETTENQFNINTIFSVTVGAIGNFGLTPFNGVAALAMVDKNQKLREVISDENKSISNLQVYSGRAFIFSCKILLAPQPGDRIVAVYKGTNDAAWKIVRGGADTTNEIIIKADLTSISEMKQEIQFTAFCDKRQEMVTVYLPEGARELNVYDVNGRLLRQIQTEGKINTTFSCEEYPAGVYILQAVTNKGTKQCKFLK
ncbi:thiol protease/hemagglutinin PrtT [uncultured Bacteroides sp.]|uniref:thiol protease/hemagglutinin PrtT n=1 Tax=uncultured Bacteroides sp. TaxID=162156 RepID=UPI0025D94845|nr:thiol protease/hemagglutinin PrtT [uncultured Bacteroides sp.]